MEKFYVRNTKMFIFNGDNEEYRKKKNIDEFIGE